MKSLVVYSSRTGNTEKVARAIHEILPAPCDIHSVETAPDPGDYGFVAIGFWMDKGEPDTKAKDYMKRVQGRKVGLFGTLGAWPDSDHARECLDKARELMAGNEVLGTFICQGRIDPAVLEMMRKMASAAHPMTPERQARIREAEKHPDEADLLAAQAAFRDMAARLGATGTGGASCAP